MQDATPPPVELPARAFALMLACAAGLALTACRERGPEPVHENPLPDQQEWIARPLTNSLGMKFVPVRITGGPTDTVSSKKRVFLCVHCVRKRDYRAYAESVPGVDDAWKNVDFQGAPVSFAEDHPVVMVSWEDAVKFCAWLSRKEGKTYRLPTDHEWSCAVGIGEKEAPFASPLKKNDLICCYPWGRAWPPVDGAGNFADEALRRQINAGQPLAFIHGYDDGFATTAPVMSFAPNQLGLYDMLGNVGQWCEDWLSDEKEYRVTRGVSWQEYDAEDFGPQARKGCKPQGRNSETGFRVALIEGD